MILELLDHLKKENSNTRVIFHPWFSNDMLSICININFKATDNFDPAITGRRECQKEITSILDGDTSWTGGCVIEAMIGKPLRIWKRASAP